MDKNVQITDSVRLSKPTGSSYALANCSTQRKTSSNSNDLERQLKHNTGKSFNSIVTSYFVFF